VRTHPECGHIFDHFYLVYDYANGVKGFHFTRQQDRCAAGVIEDVWGEKGTLTIRNASHRIAGEKPWRWEGPGNNMYDTEHEVLFKAIREGKPVNDGERM